MTQIDISYGTARWLKWLSVFPSLCFTFILAAQLFKIWLDNTVDSSFYLILVLFIVFFALLLLNLSINRANKIKIDDEHIDIHLSGKGKIHVEWVDVSKLEITPSNIIFHLHGGTKRRKVDYLSLRYKDVKPLKDVIESICTAKNIPLT